MDVGKTRGRVILPPQEAFGDIFGCHNWGEGAVPLASSEWS